MTQISGKIYQMWNAAGTEKRFPRTVIEAVYGLSSYLQQQFASLADKYMPIEGISEALTGQEFVYRISPNTIKAKSLTLDRILGRTLAWNQLIQSNRVRGNSYTHNGVTWTVDSMGVITANGTASGTSQFEIYLDNNTSGFHGVNTHKYYARLVGYGEGTLNTYFGRVIGNGSGFGSDYGRPAIQTCNDGTKGTGILYRVASGYTISNKKFFPVLVDLTLLYGSAIDGMTDAQILAKFESEFSGYQAYSAGKLISNDAEALETVGFNLWDEDYKRGCALRYADGVEQFNPLCGITSYIPVLPGTAYYTNLTSVGSSVLGLVYYDANKNYISGMREGGGEWSPTFTTPAGCRYIRATFYLSDAGTICINLSDASRNGQYEPYWKRTLPLNLKNIRVKSHNIWDEEWELGAISVENGNNVALSTRIRSKNHIPVFGGTKYFFKAPQLINVIQYDINKNFISSFVSFQNEEKTLAANCAFVRFATANDNYGTTYNNDICINVSSSFNGQYEPHGILTFNGVPSAGSVYDEIVGNKYIKRVGKILLKNVSGSWVYNSAYGFYNTNYPWDMKKGTGDSANANIVSNRFTASNRDAMTTTNNIIALTTSAICCSSTLTNASAFKSSLTDEELYYELATPIEYELVEPLVPTVKAGTTEARISPNADGLSAPFRADMTYSAQENNDSASSQYAAVAGRLLNPQTIWGQTFDGSSPVTGALTGVTTINGTAIQINSSGNVGIGTAATTAKFKVNGEIDCGGITCGGEAIFTDGIELDSTASYKIWYDDEYNRIIFTVPSGDYLYSTGGIVSASYITAGASASSSDAALKDNITSVTTERAISIFSALDGKEWDWNDKMTAFEGQHCSGLVAQEVQKVMPWAVLDYNDTLSLNYNCLWGIAIPVIQNLMHRVEELESKLKTN